MKREISTMIMIMINFTTKKSKKVNHNADIEERNKSLRRNHYNCNYSNIISSRKSRYCKVVRISKDNNSKAIAKRHNIH